VAATVVIVALLAVNTAAAAPASAPCPSGAPVLELANPNPGDVLPTGDLIISGATFDPSGSAISRVDLFLGQRDTGGLFLGSAVPSGQSFSVKASVPNSSNGGRDFVAYAYSASGQQTSVSVPIFVGAAPTPTPTGTSARPVALSETVSSTCGSVVTPAQTNPAAFQPLPLNPTIAAPMLQLANPSSGDVLPTGDIIIQGQASDASGSPVTRVDLFLGDRDTGGLFLGSALPSGQVWQIKASVPSSTNGGHDFVAYALSASGQQTRVSVPVFVGAAPTPTPRPTSN